MERNAQPVMLLVLPELSGMEANVQLEASTAPKELPGTDLSAQPIQLSALQVQTGMEISVIPLLHVQLGQTGMDNCVQLMPLNVPIIQIGMVSSVRQVTSTALKDLLGTELNVNLVEESTALLGQLGMDPNAPRPRCIAHQDRHGMDPNAPPLLSIALQDQLGTVLHAFQIAQIALAASNGMELLASILEPSLMFAHPDSPGMDYAACKMSLYLPLANLESITMERSV